MGVTMCVACSSARSEPHATSVPHQPAPPPAASCANLTLDALLARVAERYGSIRSVAARLPRVESLEVETNGRNRSNAEFVLTQSGMRRVGTLSGLPFAAGIDAEGPWEISPVVGILGRLRREEAVDTLFDEWLVRRGYLQTSSNDELRCEPGTPYEATIVYRSQSALGTPTLTADVDGTLREVHADGMVGRTVRFLRWSEAEDGVRFPTETVAVDTHDNRKRERVTGVTRDTCRGLGERPTPVAECLTPPATLSIEWPASGEVHVAMRHYLGAVSLQVNAWGRQMWALLDSGAGTTVVDATTPAARSFVPAGSITGAAVSQKVQLGLGSISELTLGHGSDALQIRNLPAASVPIPALDGFGNRRPELVLGFSFFAAAVVRIDYAKGELVLFREAARAHAANAIALPVRWQNGGMIADIMIEGHAAPIKLDTGNAGGLSLAAWWANEHGIPGTRPTLSIAGNSGAGTEEATSSWVRLAHARLGPIQFDDQIATIDPMPKGEMVSMGLAGNDLFSRCTRVTFDLGARTLWLEPPCTRPVTENLAGWHLERSPHPTRPWVVKQLVPGGSAERAGIRLGDRVSKVDGIPAVLDVERFRGRFERRAGSKVSVEVLRDGKPVQLTVELVRLLSPAP